MSPWSSKKCHKCKLQLARLVRYELDNLCYMPNACTKWSEKCMFWDKQNFLTCRGIGYNFTKCFISPSHNGNCAVGYVNIQSCCIMKAKHRVHKYHMQIKYYEKKKRLKSLSVLHYQNFSLNIYTNIYRVSHSKE